MRSANGRSGDQNGHILRTAKRLRSAVSRPSTGQIARFSSRFVHLFAVSAAKSSLIYENVT